MRSRFSSHQKTALLGLPIVPSILVNLPTDDYTTKVSKLADMYRDDLPSPDCISSELDCWWIKWEQHLQEHGRCSFPSTPVVTVRHASSMYPNIRALVTILCTLPITSCSAERSDHVKLTAPRTTRKITGRSAFMYRVGCGTGFK